MKGAKTCSCLKSTLKVFGRHHGYLRAFNEAYRVGEIPSDCHFKMSARTGISNPYSAYLMESIGLDSINPVRDIQLQMLSAMRQAVDVPIDIHTENPVSSGGFIRHYEVPEMIRVAPLSILRQVVLSLARTAGTLLSSRRVSVPSRLHS